MARTAASTSALPRRRDRSGDAVAVDDVIGVRVFRIGIDIRLHSGASSLSLSDTREPEADRERIVGIEKEGERSGQVGPLGDGAGDGVEAADAVVPVTSP